MDERSSNTGSNHRRMEDFWNSVHKLLVGFISVAVIGLVAIVLDTQKQMIEVKTTLVSINTDRYYGKDATRDFQLRDAAIDNIRELMKLQVAELREIKERLRKLETQRGR